MIWDISTPIQAPLYSVNLDNNGITIYETVYAKVGAGALLVQIDCIISTHIYIYGGTTKVYASSECTGECAKLRRFV